MTVPVVDGAPGDFSGPIHFYLYGKYQDPAFHRIKVAMEHLSKQIPDAQCTIKAFFETQFEQNLKYIVGKYGSSFNQCKPSAPIVWAETNDSILYFLNETRFMQWCLKQFRYEDNTRLIFYKRIGNKTLAAARAETGRSYCAFSVQIGEEAKELVQIELFDEECPVLAKNFLDLLAKDSFQGTPVHRVKANSWIQAGDLVDGSGVHSEAANGGFLRDESFVVEHDRAGLIGMANHGQDTNGSQFYITLRDLPFLDRKWVIIGRVISGMRTMLRVNKVALKNERPVQDVRIFAEPEYSVVGTLQNQTK
eukprot:CAMPEP_0206488476 /NCGR_PEP_ID=MMETSP0324_2-20121206/42443_1 /ASSEMBLY_ACC=CAM_ASM_000836 /TAXON_ID=2866 /ORGANISM="Crypthecodinium cohnii, Strain Seligo" /LENGTH=306 /DNA_ID=CAMNT_0053967523 /DNA_START=178 /DNA_END=1098 /DNA_ORIENTATION=+